MDSKDRNKLRREVSKRFNEDMENCAIEQFFENNIPSEISRSTTPTSLQTADENNTQFTTSIDENTEIEQNIPVQRKWDDVESKKRKMLANWAVMHNISHQAINDLLIILNDDQLPCDARTLLQTPSKKKNVTIMNQGEYYYFGIKNNIIRLLNEEEYSNVDVLINIDGLPLFNSSKLSAWPILMSIENIKNKKPFPVAIWCGEGKAKVDLFLKDFVYEMREIMSNGIKINNRSCSINLIAFVCDAPARSYIKQIKSHTGYYSCERCVQRGDYLQTVTFQKLNASLRNDETFRQKTNVEHHTGISPLEVLKVDMVFDFALDYMHLVCLGVTRRLVNIWIAGDLSHRLSAQQISLISQKIKSMSRFVPIDFSRKLRTLNYVKHWKATEFRMFLLYYGPLVLKNILPSKYYNHFMLLSCAIRILCCNYRYSKYSNVADYLLKKFVINFRTIYGAQHLVYNVHNLIHLTNECLRRGTLDNWSAFKFENYLGHIKKMMRSGNKPLQQIVNRLNELQSNSSKEMFNRVNKDLYVNNTLLSHRFPNNYVTLKNGDIFKISKIIHRNDITHECVIYGNKYCSKKDLFVKPLNAKMLGIISLRSNINDCSEKIRIKKSEIRNKLFVIYTNAKKLICFPM